MQALFEVLIGLVFLLLYQVQASMPNSSTYKVIELVAELVLGQLFDLLRDELGRLLHLLWDFILELVFAHVLIELLEVVFVVYGLQVLVRLVRSVGLVVRN